jgi:site-specific DNA recombinase
VNRKEQSNKLSIEKQAVIYCRVSTQEQVEGFSLSMQELACREYCKKKNWNVLRLFSDEGESAKTADRPRFKEMLAFCEKHHHLIGQVVLYRLDRFSRNKIDFFTITAMLKKNGIKLVSVTQGIEDTPEGSLMEGIVACFGEYESAVIGIRTTDGMKEARRQGRLTNAPPVGYKFSTSPEGNSLVVIDPERGPHISEAFRMYASGNFTKTQIAKHLSLMGYTSPRGKKGLSPQDLDRMLHNKTYRGLVFIDDAEGYAKSAFDPLIDEQTFERVQVRLTSRFPQAKPHVRVREDFPLRGSVRCSYCGQTLTSSFSRGRSSLYPYYRCFNRGCKRLEVRKEIIEKSFLELLERLELSDRSQKAIHASLVGIHLERQSQVQEERQRLEARITELEKKRANLTMAYACEKAISSEDYEQLMKELKTSLAGARIEREELEDDYMNLAELFDFALYLLADPKRMWLKSSLEQRLAIQKRLFPEGLKYSIETGFGTAVTSEYFRILEELADPDIKLATPTGFEPVLPA